MDEINIIVIKINIKIQYFDFYCLYTFSLNFKGKLTHDEKSNTGKDTGFATVEESSIGRNKVDRGMLNSINHNCLH